MSKIDQARKWPKFAYFRIVSVLCIFPFFQMSQHFFNAAEKSLFLGVLKVLMKFI